MFHIKPEALVGLFERYQGHSFVSLETTTVPKLLKKGRNSGETIMVKFGVQPDSIRKYSEFSAAIGLTYAYTVMNRLIRDGKSPFDYQPGQVWHEAYGTSTVIRRHKTSGELYFYVSLVTNNPPKSEYRSNLIVLSTKDLKEFLPLDYFPANQGLDPGREVEVRTLKLVSVTKLVAEGATFIVLP